MVTIKWCLKQKNGLELAEPNDNMSRSYLNMAQESIKVLSNIEQSRIWKATTSYYIFYYSLYALMIKIGAKCEIHSCSLAFMKEGLSKFYNQKDIDMIEKAFKARIDLQYYSDRPVDGDIIEEVTRYCKDFFAKTKKAISVLNEKEIGVIRDWTKEQISS